MIIITEKSYLGYFFKYQGNSRMVKRKRRKIDSRKRFDNIEGRKNKKNLLLNISLVLILVLIVYLAHSLFETDEVENKEFIESSEKKVEKTAEKSDVKKEVKKIESTVDNRSAYKIQVLNGCGIGGVAVRFTNIIRANGFDVAETGNYVPLGGDGIDFNVRETMIIDRSGEYDLALEIARILGTDVVIKQLSKDIMVDVSVVIGRDYRKLKGFK